MLELIAYVWMTFNHVTYIFLSEPIYIIKYFPVVPVIFALLIVNGYNKTKSLEKYKNRIALIAVLAQPLNVYLFQVRELNIVFSLLILIYVLEGLERKELYRTLAIYIIILILVLWRVSEGIFYIIVFGLIFQKLFLRIEGILNSLQNRKINKVILRNYYIGHLVILALIKFIMEGGYI